DHSRHCALSLSLVAGGWTLSTAVYALHLLTSSLESLLLVTVIVVGVLDLAGIVTAILGLLDVAVERRTPLSGRRQAVWALILAPLSLAGIAYGATHPPDPIPKGWRMETTHPGMKARSGSKKYLFLIPPQDWVQLE